MLKDLYKQQQSEWQSKAIDLCKTIAEAKVKLADAEARVDYYQRRIAVIKHGPRVVVLEAAE